MHTNMPALVGRKRTSVARKLANATNARKNTGHSRKPRREGAPRHHADIADRDRGRRGDLERTGAPGIPAGGEYHGQLLLEIVEVGGNAGWLKRWWEDQSAQKGVP